MAKVNEGEEVGVNDGRWSRVSWLMARKKRNGGSWMIVNREGKEIIYVDCIKYNILKEKLIKLGRITENILKRYWKSEKWYFMTRYWSIFLSKKLFVYQNFNNIYM